MIVLLTIIVAVIAYFTWRISVAIWTINNMLGVVVDAFFKISASPEMRADEIRQTLQSVSQKFVKEFGIEVYKHVTGQV